MVILTVIAPTFAFLPRVFEAKQTLMMKYFGLMCLTGLLAIAGCKDDDNMPNPLTDDDYLIFGTFYGECLGNCTHLFKLEDGRLYADEVNIGIPEEIEFEEYPMSEEDYELAEELWDVPDDITQSDQTIWGCPDCADQGGVYLEIFSTEGRSKYRIDTRNDDLTEDIIAYKDRVLQIVAELEE